MEIGMPKERGGRGGDVRVPVMPAEAAALTAAGHRLVVERGAGDGVYASDAAKIRFHGNRDELRYSIHESRAAGLTDFMEYLDERRRMEGLAA